MPDDKYAAERGNPSGALCGKHTLLFDSYYLKLLTNGKVTDAWHARSGKKVGGLFDYTPARQKVKDAGPIPEGAYWIQPKQLYDTWFWDEDAWGDYRITIHVTPGTVTHSRGGFFIHGGKTFGSAGCIDLSYAIGSFAAELRRIAPATPGSGCQPAIPNDCYIPLTVKYSATSLADP
jgi:Protein of unknown function (DUF2778)